MAESTTALLFTDIEASTRLWQADPEAMDAALEMHDTLLRGVVERDGGHVIKSTGDGLFATFGSADAAIAAAADAQLALDLAPREAIGPLHVRIGVHWGVARERDGDLFGPDVNRAARMTAAAHGGQVLVSAACRAQVVELASPLGLEDLGEYQLRDVAAPEHLYQLRHPGLRGDFPPLRAPSLRSRMPVHRDRFVGRERERDELRELLRAQRLVTLTGPAGVGKTRLALEVAQQVQGSLPGGVSYVALSALTNEELVPAALASSMGLRTDRDPPLQVVTDYLRDQEALVVIDNCEHLLDGCAAVVDRLLNACPRLHVFATSRERLGVRGEAVFPVQPLAGDVEDAGLDLLFERAGVGPEQRVNEEIAATARQIVRRLDGLPLALELAAAKVPTLGLSEVARGLDDRFALLTRRPGGEDAPHHATLETAIGWSYRLLDNGDRALLMRLSVFAGGFTLPSARAMCASPDLAASAITAGLSSLAEKSLVTATAEEGGTIRYSLLESVLEFARARLAESGEAERWRDAHARHVIELVEGQPDPLTAEDGLWLALVESNIDNVRAAFAHLLASNDIDPCARLSAALTHYWLEGGLAAEGLHWVDQILDRLAIAEAARMPAVPPAIAAQLDEQAGDLAAALDRADAGKHWQRALERIEAQDALSAGRLHRKLGERSTTEQETQAYVHLECATQLLGEPREEDLQQGREWINLQLHALNRAYLRSDTAEQARLENLVEPWIQRLGTIAHQFALAEARVGLDLRRYRYAPPPRTVRRFQRARLLIDPAFKLRYAEASFDHAFLLMLSGEFDLAALQLERAHDLELALGARRAQCRSASYLSLMHRRLGNAEESLRWAEDALRLGRTLKVSEYEALASANLGWVAWQAGDADELERRALAALELWRERTPRYPFTWPARWPLIAHWVETGRLADTRVHFSALLELHEQAMPDALARLVGRAAAQDGTREDAVRAVTKASALRYL